MTLDDSPLLTRKRFSCGGALHNSSDKYEALSVYEFKNMLIVSKNKVSFIKLFKFDFLFKHQV